MRVVAMFRVSTEAQANEGASLDAQERAYREMARKNGWDTVAEFRGCESATQAASDRRVLQQVLACIRDHTPDALYVHEQSRLTRGDDLEVAMLMRELKERRLKIVINGLVRDLTSIDERFMVGIQSLVDRAESERIKERFNRGRRERGRQGKKNTGAATYGYTNPPPGDPRRGTLQVVPVEAAVVRRIFQLRVEGKGEVAIARELQARGVAAPRGGASWGKTSVGRILRNPAYIGVHETNVWVADKGRRNFRYVPDNPNAIRVEDAHEPIIDRETWDAVRGRRPLVRAKVPRLLAGLLFVNGSPAHGDSDSEIRLYRGPRGVAGLPWLPAAETDESVWAAFVRLATGPDLVARMMAEAANQKDRRLLEMDLEHARDQAAKLARRAERLIEMRADGDLTKEQFRRKQDESEEALARLRADIAGYEARLRATDGSMAPRVVKAVQTLLAGRTSLTRDQKRRVLETIVRRIDVQAERNDGDFERDGRGRVLPGRKSRWRIVQISFRLAIPSGEPDPCDEPDGIQDDHAKAGQSGTTCSSSDQLSQTAAGGRAGHSDTAASCSAPREPARR